MMDDESKINNKKLRIYIWKRNNKEKLREYSRRQYRRAVEKTKISTHCKHCGSSGVKLITQINGPICSDCVNYRHKMFRMLKGTCKPHQIDWIDSDMSEYDAYTKDFEHYPAG
jgi:hypothetical protein